MQIKKLVLAGAAAALVGGFAFAPNATAAEGECDPIEEAAPVADVVVIHGEQPGAGEGCLVLEAGGAVPVNPLDDGHIGVYEKADGTPGLYGSCDGRDADGNLKPLDPAAGDSDPTKCNPAG